MRWRWSIPALFMVVAATCLRRRSLQGTGTAAAAHACEECRRAAQRDAQQCESTNSRARGPKTDCAKKLREQNQACDAGPCKPSP